MSLQQQLLSAVQVVVFRVVAEVCLSSHFYSKLDGWFGSHSSLRTTQNEGRSKKKKKKKKKNQGQKEGGGGGGGEEIARRREGVGWGEPEREREKQ